MPPSLTAGIVLGLLALLPPASLQAVDASPPAPGLKDKVAAIGAARQAIVVVTAHWKSVHARVRCLERATPSAPWKEVAAGPPFDAVVGRNGLAWGIGLHGTHPAGGPVKREGDGRAPAGVFLLETVFGYAARAQARITAFAYLPLTATTEGVDDPKSHFYNRVVETRDLRGKDWNSSEAMRGADGLYRWGAVVEHNWKPFPGYGSCIFLHVWRGAGVGTAGCTATEAGRMEQLVRWLDRRSHPVLIQLPATEYARLKSQWLLP